MLGHPAKSVGRVVKHDDDGYHGELMLSKIIEYRWPLTNLARTLPELLYCYEAVYL